MEYLYATGLLQECGTAVDQARMTRVLVAAGIEPDQPQLRAFLAAREELSAPEAER